MTHSTIHACITSTVTLAADDPWKPFHTPGEVLKEGGDATMRVSIVTAKNEAHPDMIGFTIHLAVEQSVFIQRFDKVIRTPTCTAIHVGFFRRDDAPRQISRLLDEILWFLIGEAEKANTVSKATGGASRPPTPQEPLPADLHRGTRRSALPW